MRRIHRATGALVLLPLWGCAGEATPAPARDEPPAVARTPGRTDVGYELRVRCTHYFAGERHSDPDTDAGRSSTGVRLRPATATQAGVCAVDPAVIPYGSRVIVQTPAGARTYVAADTGGAVVHRTASGGTAPVVDFYSRTQVGGEYQVVHVIPYAGATPFARLTAAGKAAVLSLGATPR